MHSHYWRKWCIKFVHWEWYLLCIFVPESVHENRGSSEKNSSDGEKAKGFLNGAWQRRTMNFLSNKVHSGRYTIPCCYLFSGVVHELCTNGRSVSFTCLFSLSCLLCSHKYFITVRLRGSCCVHRTSTSDLTFSPKGWWNMTLVPMTLIATLFPWSTAWVFNSWIPVRIRTQMRFYYKTYPIVGDNLSIGVARNHKIGGARKIQMGLNPKHIGY